MRQLGLNELTRKEKSFKDQILEKCCKGKKSQHNCSDKHAHSHEDEHENCSKSQALQEREERALREGPERPWTDRLIFSESSSTYYCLDNMITILSYLSSVMYL